MPALYGGPVRYCIACTVVPLDPTRPQAGRYRYCGTCGPLRLAEARRRATRRSGKREYWRRRAAKVCPRCRTPVDRLVSCLECRQRDLAGHHRRYHPTKKRRVA